MSRFFYLIGLCVFALPVRAGENIVLRTGFQLVAERHELQGDTIRIFSADGVTEMPASLVARVEAVAPEPAETPKSTVAEPSVEMTAPQSAPRAPVELAQAAALKYSLPAGFVTGVMRAESGFNISALSPKGAIGLMQLMPGTARDLGVDPTRPSENADAGARYLRELLGKYEDKPDQVVLALAAYNAGPAAVDKYHGVPPYRETREYILRVLKAWNPSQAGR